MDNPAVHDLDDVRLRAENGQLVLEVDGQTTPVNVDIDGALSLDELEGFTDDEISLLQSKLVDAGHDEVDVPQVRNLTVADFESGVLSDAYSNDTSQFSVETSQVKNGSFALNAVLSQSGDAEIKRSDNGLQNTPQPGDLFETHVYLTDTNDEVRITFGSQKLATNNEDYQFEVNAAADRIRFVEHSPNNLFGAVNSPISNYLNEWLKIEFHWGIDYTFNAVVYDSLGNEIGSASASPSVKSRGAGGIGFKIVNDVSSSEVYFDSFTLKRRSPEYFAETKAGTTQLGNEVTPSGAIHTGPLESSTNALRQEYATAPVNSDATQGDTSLLTLLKSGVNPAMYLERTMDGQGGAYGHQLQTALGRFARINANLSWEYESLADVLNWTSASSGGTFTFNVNSRPRRIHVEHDGSGNNVSGALFNSTLVSYEVLGAWRVMFKNVSFTDNGNTAENYLLLGVSDVDPTTTRIDKGGNGVMYRDSLDVDRVLTVNGGTTSDTTGPQVDWTVNHDVILEFDGFEASLYIDGELWASVSDSPRGDMQPVIQLRDGGGNTTSDTVEVEQVTVEPLAEVLQ